MAPLSFLAAALVVAAASAAPGDHITDAPITPLTVPQLYGNKKAALSSGHHEHALFRRLTVDQETGVVADMYDEHAFLGATDAGFFDMSYQAVLKGESVSSADYVRLNARVLGAFYTLPHLLSAKRTRGTCPCTMS